MSQNNILALAKLPLNELHRIRDELREVNREFIRGQKMMAPRMEAVNEAIRMAETPAEDFMVTAMSNDLDDYDKVT